MEYEQAEYVRRVVMEAITRQDVNAYFDLLNPNVMLVTHFPYPAVSTDSNVGSVQQWGDWSHSRRGVKPQDAAAAAASRARQRARQLLAQQEKKCVEQRTRYENFRKRREGHHSALANDHPPTDLNRPAASAAGGAGAAETITTDTRGVTQTQGIATVGRKKTISGRPPAKLPDGVRWYCQQQQESGGGGGREGSISAHTGQNNPARGVAGGGALMTSAGGVDHEGRLAYEDVVDVTEGRLLVCARFFELLHWASTGRGITTIAPVEIDVQLRKDILQEEEVLAPPPAPTNMQEAFEQLGTQLTERNQPLTCMTVIWGREHLLFRDRLFVDDGSVVTVHRSMLSVQEILSRAAPVPAKATPPATAGRVAGGGQGSGGGGGVQPSLSAAQPEHVYNAVEAFYGVSLSRVVATNTAWPLLDFSFVEATEPARLLRLTPVSGHVHAGAPPRVATDPRLAQGVFLTQETDPTTAAGAGPARTLIKAKNKKGEEEAYEFQNSRNRFAFVTDSTEESDAVDGERGAGEAGSGYRGGGKNTRYDAACMRVSGCQLQAHMEQLVPVLRRLVANCILTLHTLDLSQNKIATLPDISALPLQTLRLHDNAIADWRVVEQRIAPLPFLSNLTLHGNPIAEDTAPTRAMAMDAAVTAKQNRHHGHGHRGPSLNSQSSSGATTTAGDPIYWRRLLGLLLENPARLAALRQVDFVTLTRQDLHMAGAHTLFTTGTSTVLDKVRTMEVGSTTKSSTGRA